MADSDPSGSAAPPKKRSIFKKAAWQSEVKAEGSKDKDIFSHSNEYQDIVADEERQKKEERATRDAERRRKHDGDGERKRRRISIEDEGIQMPSSGSGESHRRRTERNHRSRTPLSPVLGAPIDSLSSRYDDLTRSLDSGSPVTGRSMPIELSDSDLDSDVASMSLAKKSRPPILSNDAPPPSDDLEEIEDPRFAELAARARARQITKGSSSESKIDSHSSVTPVVQLLIESMVPNAADILVKIRINDSLGKPLAAWCKARGFDKQMADSVFLTWKGNKLLNTTTVQRLGVSVNPKDPSILHVQGDSNIYTDKDPPKIHLRAFTHETYRQWKREQAAEEEEQQRRKASFAAPNEDEDPSPPPEPEPQKIRVKLKAKGKDEFGLSVNPDTLFCHVASAYKKKHRIPEEQPVSLFFDGARLKPMESIADSEIEDMDTIEVHFK
ncbi:hypothetical protein EJ04DRAFT_266879 [Polyplosphaeria fusca]|uniref:Ubiquitin-like domain-containing protein n=1 Tax=Polyplosphaeria fusca TaxID=682080 RepID=A0A9P4QYX5_9PLEO|nr:hypothetical protein EJ04DRAFT_266879 [Polyplosphaeria fusca]